MHKRIAAISNEFHISKELFDGNTLTLGNFTTVYNDHDTWYLGNNMLLQAISNPNPIVVDLADGANTYQLSSNQGFVSGPSYGDLRTLERLQHRILPDRQLEAGQLAV